MTHLSFDSIDAFAFPPGDSGPLFLSLGLSVVIESSYSIVDSQKGTELKNGAW